MGPAPALASAPAPAPNQLNGRLASSSCPAKPAWPARGRSSDPSPSREIITHPSATRFFPHLPLLPEPGLKLAGRSDFCLSPKASFASSPRPVRSSPPTSSPPGKSPSPLSSAATRLLIRLPQPLLQQGPQERESRLFATPSHSLSSSFPSPTPPI